MRYADVISHDLQKYVALSAETKGTCWADVPRQQLLPHLVNGLVSRGLAELPQGKFRQAKLNVANETAPIDIKEAYRTRAAAVLIHLAQRKSHGVNQMAKKFKRKLNRGNRTNKIQKANRGIIRVIMQNLEKAGLVERVDKVNDHEGRMLSREGTRFVDKCAAEARKQFSS